MINVVFIHKGKIPLHLKLAIRQLRTVIPKAIVHLVSEKVFLKREINNYSLELFTESALQFSQLYFHRSSNLYDFELFCFQRWFILREFVDTYDIQGRILYLDSDVLLFNDILSSIDLGDRHMSVTKGYGPQYSLFKSPRSIHHFTDFIMNYYREPSGIEYLENWWEEQFVKTGKKGGVCDMTILGLYADANYCLDLFYIRNGYFNSTINGMENDAILLGFEPENFNLSHFSYKESIANINTIRLNALHFQGGTKDLMPFYYVGRYKRGIRLYWRFYLFVRPFYKKIKTVLKRVYYKLKYPRGLPK